MVRGEGGRKRKGRRERERGEEGLPSIHPLPLAIEKGPQCLPPGLCWYQTISQLKEKPPNPLSAWDQEPHHGRQTAPAETTHSPQHASISTAAAASVLAAVHVAMTWIMRVPPAWPARHTL